MFHVRSNGSRSRLEIHQTRKRINKQPALFWTCQYACKDKIWYIPYGISNMDTYGISAVFSYGISTMVYQIRYEYGEMIWKYLKCYVSLLYVPAAVLLIRTRRNHANMVWPRFLRLWLWAIGKTSSYLTHNAACMLNSFARQILISLTMLDTMRCRYIHTHTAWKQLIIWCLSKTDKWSHAANRLLSATFCWHLLANRLDAKTISSQRERQGLS